MIIKFTNAAVYVHENIQSIQDRISISTARYKHRLSSSTFSLPFLEARERNDALAREFANQTDGNATPRSSLGRLLRLGEDQDAAAEHRVRTLNAMVADTSDMLLLKQNINDAFPMSDDLRGAVRAVEKQHRSLVRLRLQYHARINEAMKEALEKDEVAGKTTIEMNTLLHPCWH